MARWTARAIPSVLFLLALSGAHAQQIDAKIYAKIFAVNEPAWSKLAEIVGAEVPAGSRVLDVGAGPGEPTVTMAKKLTQHTFVLTDKQQEMVDKAVKRADGLSNVEFHVASAEDFARFPSESFDAAVGCYVLMFVDLPRALSEISRVLKPGALAWFTVWTEMPFFAWPQEALKQLYKSKGWTTIPPSPAINPMSLSPTDWAVSSVEAGIAAMPSGRFNIKQTENISYPFNFGSLQDSCDATTVLGFPFAKMAEDNGSTEGEIKSAYCAQLIELIKANVHANADGTHSLGHGTATIYTLHKAGVNPEL